MSRKVKFYKYQGTGNDFILIDNRLKSIRKADYKLFKIWCHRQFGIGADGVILLENVTGYDFKMIYFNSDGNESSMCGNGGRCLIQFAYDLKIIKKKCTFLAIDGAHEGAINGKNVSLKMIDVNAFKEQGKNGIVNTGSPHFIKFVQKAGDVDVFKEGKKVRYSKQFTSVGINVNFVERTSEGLKVRTYERGVENETLSCGTGVVGACLADSYFNQKKFGIMKINVKTLGGNLSVQFEKTALNTWKNIYLNGPAVKVFEGEIRII